MRARIVTLTERPHLVLHINQAFRLRDIQMESESGAI